MAAAPALWADLQRHLAAAEKNAAEAVARAASLRQNDLSAEVRRDREMAIGTMLHHCYGAVEAALERLILALDGDLPAGSLYRVELVRRAAAPVSGVRTAVISAETAADLQRLHAFRHAFRHAYARAAENVPLAEQVLRRFGAELGAFADAAELRD